MANVAPFSCPEKHFFAAPSFFRTTVTQRLQIIVIAQVKSASVSQGKRRDALTSAESCGPGSDASTASSDADRTSAKSAATCARHRCAKT